MNLAIQTDKQFNLAAFLVALVLHLVLVATNLSSLTPTIVRNQAIQISFVAPSSKSENQNLQKIVKDDESLIKTKKTQEQQASNKETTGIVDENATALNSAESEAVFDAAYLNNPAPHYPTIAKKRGIQGKVLLEVAVNAKGEAVNITIYQSSGSSILDKAALKTVKKWNFIPAKKAGMEIASLVLVPIEFKIV